MFLFSARICFIFTTTAPHKILQGITDGRNAARLKMGYYPLSPSDALRLRSLLDFPVQSTAFDPSGTGAALLTLTQNAAVEFHAVELDTARGAAAAENDIRIIDTAGRKRAAAVRIDQLVTIFFLQRSAHVRSADLLV